MQVSDLIARLQEKMKTDGDLAVGIVMDEQQDRVSDEITSIQTLRVSDRGAFIVINCKSISAKLHQ